MPAKLTLLIKPPSIFSSPMSKCGGGGIAAGRDISHCISAILGTSVRWLPLRCLHSPYTTFVRLKLCTAENGELSDVRQWESQPTLRPRLLFVLWQNNRHSAEDAAAFGAQMRPLNFNVERLL